MALIKAIDTEFGIPACYWNICNTQEDFRVGVIEVTFFGYASKEARLANKQPLSSGKTQITGNDYVAGANRIMLYKYIKTMTEFEGAEDA